MAKILVRRVSFGPDQQHLYLILYHHVSSARLHSRHCSFFPFVYNLQDSKVILILQHVPKHYVLAFRSLTDEEKKDRL